jgi:hypothetical protein
VENIDEARTIFASTTLPELVFEPVVTNCAWVYFDSLCCAYGWDLVSALARQHGDTTVWIDALDLLEPCVLTISADSNAEGYAAICDDDLVAADDVRWWGNSGKWGIHGSRGHEIAVVGQVADARWPRSVHCDVRTIDTAMRIAMASDEFREKLRITYDALSWDPALDDRRALPELVELCREVVDDRVDPVVAIRRLVDLVDRAPKHVRRTAATARLHQAWGRTSYLLLGAARAPFGPLLLAHNDRNHERHAAEERPLVRQACAEILEAVGRTSS